MRPTLFVPWAATAAVGLGLLLLWIEVGYGGDTVTLAAVDVANVLAAGLAALACWARARSETGSTARGFRFLAAGCLSWTLGVLYVSYYDLVVAAGVPFEERAIPFPSIADAGYLLFVPLALLGVALLPRGVFSNRRRLHNALDGGLVAVALLAIAWITVMRDVWHASAAAPWHHAVLLMAYPFGDFLLAATAAIAWQFVPREERGNFLLLVVGLGTLALADVGFGILVLRDAIGISAINVLWPAGFAAIGLAALRPATAVPGDGTTRDDSAIVPLSAAGALLAMGLTTVSKGIQPAVAVLFVLLAGLAATRMVVDAADRRALRALAKRHPGEPSLR